MYDGQSRALEEKEKREQSEDKESMGLNQTPADIANPPKRSRWDQTLAAVGQERSPSVWVHRTYSQSC